MRLLFVKQSPGWAGLRAGPFYLYLRNVRLHKLGYSERNLKRRYPLASIGTWQLWLHIDKKEAPSAEDPDGV